MKSKYQMYKTGWISLWNYLDIDCCDDLKHNPFWNQQAIYFANNIGRKK